MARMKAVRFTARSVPFAFALITLAAYGLLLPFTGFYWDDWPYLWFFHRLGPSGIIQAFTGDRPFLSFIYTICLSIFGHSVIGWQLFGLLARWLFSLSFWWILYLAWPRQVHKITWASFLFAVYPGFTQQWISVIYGQVHGRCVYQVIRCAHCHGRCAYLRKIVGICTFALFGGSIDFHAGFFNLLIVLKCQIFTRIERKGARFYLSLHCHCRKCEQQKQNQRFTIGNGPETLPLGLIAVC